MLKKIVVMAFALFTMVAGSCFAAMVGEVPAGEASLGGITLGSPMSYVRSVYGEPTETAGARTVSTKMPSHTAMVRNFLSSRGSMTIPSKN